MVSKLQPYKNFHYFGRRPFWNLGKNHISHARIPWGFCGVDTGTIRNYSKLLESVCLQFCLGSTIYIYIYIYIWAILTRLICSSHQRKHQSSASLAFVWRIHRDRWIPRTKGQLRGNCFHLMTSSCKEASSQQPVESLLSVQFSDIINALRSRQ